LTGVREPVAPDRILATVLFTDIVGSTALATEMGDRSWAELLERHHAIVRGELARFRGQEVDTAGDGFFATFDGPARAIRCARAISSSVRGLGIEIRSGLHAGECELLDGKVGGIAVHTGARVASLAGPSEVLVSSTASRSWSRDLASRSSIGASTSSKGSPANGASTKWWSELPRDRLTFRHASSTSTACSRPRRSR
jgi:class 3 adenylate cyclase